VIEGAGGVLVPINENHTVADLIGHLSATSVLVVRNYLGSINHTLLTVQYLQSQHIPILGMVFNGEDLFGNEEIILRKSGLLACCAWESRTPLRR